MILTQSDKNFLRTFAAVLGVLILITIGVAIAANTWPNPQRENRVNDPRLVQQENQRIAPIGQVNTSGKPLAPAGGDQVAAASGPQSAEDIYKGVCAACHDSGLAGAPKLTDAAAWAPRKAQGLETLVKHAIHGLNAMPPKGGNPSLSDDEIHATVEYMLAQLPGAKPAAVPQAAVEPAASQPPAAAPAEQSAAPAPAPTAAAASPAASANAPAEAAPAEQPAAAAAPSAEDLAAGKKVYGSICMACHDSGLAGAPKVGDAAAWTERRKQGLDVMVGHAINGLNAMPPKGGNPTLSDAEIKQAVEYMLSTL